MSKTKETFVKLFIMIIIMICTFAIGGEEAKADTSAQTQNEIAIKTSNLKGGKIIKSPKKEISTNSQEQTKVLNRGDYKSDGSLGSRAVSLAYNFLGIPYVYGAEGPNSFDCSGLTKYVYGKLGYSLPHYTGSQWNMGNRISDRNALVPGDLVFFNTCGPISHVGIYIGDGKFIHAPRTGKTIEIASLNDSYYSPRYAGAVRIGS